MLTSSNFMSRQAWVYMAMVPGPLVSLNLYVSRSTLMVVMRMFTDERPYTYVVVEHDIDLCTSRFIDARPQTSDIFVVCTFPLTMNT